MIRITTHHPNEHGHVVPSCKTYTQKSKTNIKNMIKLVLSCWQQKTRTPEKLQQKSAS
jgi:hypothetical protein